jgi:alkyl sulfatase BDS1-like metallo-beta-lactamase superfamily hydrolase
VKVADAFGWVVGRFSDAQLDRFMQTPARRLVLDGIFRQMPRQLDRERARGMTASIRWCITGGRDGATDVHQLDFADGTCSASRAPNRPEPQLTITLGAAEFLRLAAGQSDPTRAYFGGRVALAGDVMLAAKMGSLFRTPGAP